MEIPKNIVSWNGKDGTYVAGLLLVALEVL